ncbi:MAG: MXAN_5187 C-terminal domain-containing protein [Candidatus Acidiferrales bacterium]|jgi:hypothetical protein
MATVDEDLGQIEKDIRRLKIEYEQYFGGGRQRPPADTQWRLESLMRRYNERSAELSFGQRFRFNNLAQTYAKYVDMWRKKSIQKEGGTSQHHFGAAAKAIEAARTREASLRAQADVSRQTVSGRAPNATIRAARQQEVACFALSFSDSESEKAKISQLYQKLIEAHNESGESAAAPTLPSFERFIRKKTQELKDKGGSEVEYSVTIQDGRVKLKARISA